MARPRTHDEELRVRLLAQAADLIRRDGFRALNLRALAHQAGTSTSAVYSLFGSKDRLMSALVAWSLTDFAQHQASAPMSDHPSDDLRRLAHAYRDWAKSHPPQFAIAFVQELTGRPWTPEIDQAGQAAITPLVGAIERAIAAGDFAPRDPVSAAYLWWAVVHGLTSLELTDAGGLNPDPEGAFDAGLTVALRGFAADG